MTAANIYLSNHRGNSGYGSKSQPRVDGSTKKGSNNAFLGGHLGISWIMTQGGTQTYLFESQKLNQLKEDSNIWEGKNEIANHCFPTLHAMASAANYHWKDLSLWWKNFLKYPNQWRYKWNNFDSKTACKCHCHLWFVCGNETLQQIHCCDWYIFVVFIFPSEFFIFNICYRQGQVCNILPSVLERSHLRVSVEVIMHS